MKHRLHIFSLVFAVLLLLPLPVWATISSYTPTTSDQLKSSYYTNLEGKSGSTLFSAVVTATGGVKHTYTKLTYDELWTAYITSDVYPAGHAHAGKIWDMYANCYYATSEHVSQMKAECNGGYNREHSLPKSWFGGSSDYKSTNQGCDLVHLVPTDAYVNSDRSNYAFGEVGTVVKQFEISKRGTSVNTLSVSKSTISGTSVSTGAPTVFEPADDYKGDFARIYFYMRAHYPSLNLAQADGGTKHFSSTTSAASDSKYGLTDYSVILLMKWHRQDPVSQKEIDRNNAIEKMQGNRNPFVDYPCLAEYLWGEHAGETFSLSTAVGSFENSFTPGVSDGCACSTDPTLTVNPTSLTVDPVAVNGTSTKTFTVTGANLTGNITITKTSGSGYFTVSPSSIAAASANGPNTITVTYHPTAIGDHTATFTIASTGATSQTVTVSGTCTTVYTATWMADGSPYHQNTAASGSAPSVPEAPNDCGDDRVFMGWTATSGYSGNSAPGDLFTTTAPTITTDKTFYAVYADKSTSAGGGTGSETLTCSAGTIDNNTMRFNTTNFSVEHAKGISANFASYSPWRIYNGNTVTISGSLSITSVIITCGSEAYATAASNATLTPTGGGSVSAIVSSTKCTITANGTVTSLVISPSAQTRWSEIEINYSGGTTTTYSNYSTQCTACTPVAATASYASSTKATTVGGSVTNTFTTNSNATVSYASSNTSVATVASDGTVTPLSAGTTTITATVPANTCFTGGASASYTLTVYNFNATAATDVTCNSFTANWTSAGAASYSLDVYQGTTGSTTVSRDTTWLNESFASSSQGDFTITDVSMASGLSYVWVATASYGMKGSGNISGTAHAAESWLISPVLDLTNATSAKLTFDHTTYAASSIDDLDYLLIYVSSDGGSNWTNLTIPTWPSKRWTFVSSGEIDLTTYASSNVKIAFCYKSTSTYAGTWEVKNVVLTGKYDKTISTSSVEHVPGYPKNVSGTSASVTGLDASTTYKYTVTPQGGSASNEIEVTTPACSCTATITATSNDDSMGMVGVTLP